MAMGQRRFPLKHLKVLDWKGTPLQVVSPPVAWGFMALKLTVPEGMGFATTAAARERTVIRAVNIILYVLLTVVETIGRKIEMKRDIKKEI